MKERNALDSAISGYRSLEQELKDNVELIELAEADGDQDMVVEAEKDLASV
jgi:peptide chain release factor 2